MLHFLNKKNKNFHRYYLILFFLIISIPISYAYGALSCSVTTVGACGGTVLLRMSGTDNAHAELPSQATLVYDNNVVCCTGVAGLSNSCALSNNVVIAKLSDVTNAHVERNTENNYAQNACISSTYAGDLISIEYQASDCSGYNTTLFSMENTPTNSQVGLPATYNNKVCANIFSQAISFNISEPAVGFGILTSGGLRYATSDGLGSATETESYAITASTNAASGYGIYVQGGTLKDGASTITAIGGTNITPTPGTNAFGVRAVATGGIGAVVSPYDGSGFAYDATNSIASNIATATSGNGIITSYSVRTVATIDSLLDYGSYSTNLTYIIVPNY